MWLQCIQDVFEAIGWHNVSDKKKILSAGLRLKGQAWHWFTCCREDFLTPGAESWATFEAAFLQEFQPDRATLEQQLMDDCQKMTESFSAYATRFRVGCIEAFGSESKDWPGYMKRHFLRGVHNPNIKQYLMTQDIEYPNNTFNDIVTAGIKMERL